MSFKIDWSLTQKEKKEIIKHIAWTQKKVPVSKNKMTTEKCPLKC